MKILAVDDSPTMLEILVNTLQEAGHRVVQAVNGKDAIKNLSDDVDLIISDLNMIVLSGFEFLSHVRNSDQYMATPFVFLTTETDAELKQAARSAGATAWIVKPFKPQDLVQFISRFDPAH